MPSSIDVTDDPADFEEAVRAFRRRVPMPDWKWDALTEAEKEFAFKVSGAAQADLATQAWEAMDRAIKDGTTLDDFKKQVGSQLEAAWGRKDPARLETIFRTNALGAYNAGRHEILNHPEVKKARPYWRFDGIDDDRQTEICAALDGTIRPADDPFWNTHTPPLHFNCRSVLVPLSQEEAEEEGVDKEAPDVDADDGFGKQPSGDEPGAGWEPDPKDYPAPIAEVLEAKLEEVAPEPEPDYGTGFPKVDPEAPPRELPTVDPIKWERPTPKHDGIDFVAQNDRQLKDAAQMAQRLTGTGTGVSAHIAKPELQNGAAGLYWNARGQIELLQHYVAEPMRNAVLRGEVIYASEENAFQVVLHEQMHAASNPDRFGYERGRTQMEESTTEILAQHYKRDYIKGLGLTNRVPVEAPMFLQSELGPVLVRPIAYTDFIQGFARLVSYVDAVAVDDAVAFERHVVGRALQVKRAAGSVDDNARYGMFVRPVLVKHGVKPTDVKFATISERLTHLFADFIKAGTTSVSALDESVKQIVAGADYK